MKKITYIAISSMLLSHLLYSGIGDKKTSEAKPSVNCFTATAAEGGDAKAIDISIGEGASNIVFQGGFSCHDITQTSVSGIGKRGDLIVFTPSQLPNQVGVNLFDLGRIDNERTQGNIAFPKNIGDGILFRFQPTQGELAGITIELLMKRTTMTPSLQKTLSQDLNADIDPRTDALFTYYRRLRSRRRPEVSWLELGYSVIDKKNMPAGLSITVNDDANGIVINHAPGAQVPWALGKRKLMPTVQQRIVPAQEGQ